MLKERCRQFRYTEQHQSWDYQNADLKKINFQIAAVLSLLAMAVAEAGYGGYGHHGDYGKRAVDYGYNGHAYGLNTDHNMRRYEDQNFGSFGQIFIKFISVTYSRRFGFAFLLPYSLFDNS